MAPLRFVSLVMLLALGLISPTFAAGVPKPMASRVTTAADWSPPPPNCPIFPLDNIWNTDISTLPVHAKSATWVATIGANKTLWVGFAPNTFGMKYALTDPATPKVPITIVGQDPSDSDVPGPYPFTATTPLEVGNPDAHAFMIDTVTCTLYEMYLADWNNGTPQAHAAVIWDLGSNALRADGHSSADEAGLAMFCGLARWDEVQAGAIRHALRFEATEAHIDGTTGAHLWPARHDTQTPNSSAPPMGARFRLKASYDISGFSPHTQVVLQALKHYGMFVSDVGLDWELVGTADPGWDTNLIQELFTVPTNQFEAVDESSLMIDPNSAQAYNNLANLLRQRGDLGGAIAQYRLALEKDPTLDKPHLGLGMALGSQGDFPAARKHFEQAAKSADLTLRHDAQEALKKIH